MKKIKSVLHKISIKMKKNFDFSGWIFQQIFIYKNKFRIFIFNYPIHLICHIKGVKMGKRVKFNGMPLIRRYENSKIVFGDNCILNSAKNSVEIGLLQPCTIVTLRKNSEIIFGSNSGATGISIMAAMKVQIGNNVLIGAKCTIFDNDFHNSHPKRRSQNDYSARPVIIEDNVFIGYNCLILKGVTIGENSVIGAESVVIHSIPKNSIAIGNPCKVVITKQWD